MSKHGSARVGSGRERRARASESLAGTWTGFPGPAPLRDALDAYVAERRAEGAASECVLGEVKRLVAQLGFSRRLDDGSAPAVGIEKWALESYFRRRE